MESFEEERHAKTKQIEALKDLCTKAGITDSDIAACAPRHQRQVNTTLCALSSVARLSVSMTMLMSSGIYRPRLFDEDGLTLPKVIGPKTKDQVLRSSQRHHLQQFGSNLPRIESLPIIQDRSASTSGKQQRKSAYAKAGRKQYGAGSKTYHQPVIETKEDGAGPTTTRDDGDEGEGGREESAPTTDDAPRHQTLVGGNSPVNSSGVHILIDGSSDVEADDHSTENLHSSSTGVNATEHTGRYSDDTSEVKVTDRKTDI